MEQLNMGFAFCGSSAPCTGRWTPWRTPQAGTPRIVPIVSERVAATDTRFGNAHDFMREMERICRRRVIATVEQAEPLGPKEPLDILVICPCTGNTLGKLAGGVTDSAVTMAAKAHLRNGRPWCWPSPPTTAWAARRPTSARCWPGKTSTLSPFGQDGLQEQAHLPGVRLLPDPSDRPGRPAGGAAPAAAALRFREEIGDFFRLWIAVSAPAGIRGPRRNPAKRFRWGEEEQGSEAQFSPSLGGNGAKRTLRRRVSPEGDLLLHAQKVGKDALRG